jgi:hypothetical protein
MRAKKGADGVVGDHQQENEEEGDDERRVLATEVQQRSGKRDRRSLSGNDAPKENAKLDVPLHSALQTSTRRKRRWVGVGDVGLPLFRGGVQLVERRGGDDIADTVGTATALADAGASFVGAVTSRQNLSNGQPSSLFPSPWCTVLLLFPTLLIYSVAAWSSARRCSGLSISTRSAAALILFGVLPFVLTSTCC